MFVGKIAAKLNLEDRAAHWKSVSNTMHKEIMEKAWNPELKCLVSVWGGNEVDPYLLYLTGKSIIDLLKIN
jgi:GH15 family glucan-1,4-alpha-glucosidase